MAFAIALSDGQWSWWPTCSIHPVAAAACSARPHDVLAGRELLRERIDGLPRLRAVVGDRAYRPAVDRRATPLHAGAMVGTPSPCPGCGVVLEATDWPMARRANASPACWHLYTQVLSYETEHLARLGRYHQLTVDAYGAQHAGAPSPPISTAFGLIGLYLALEHDWSGTAVRAAHQFLAQRYSTWPSFRRRADGPVLTVADVAGATTPDEHASRVQAWGRTVWNLWEPAHLQVRAWAEAVLSPEVCDRLRLA